MVRAMHTSWQRFAEAERAKPYFAELSAFLQTAYADGEVYPPQPYVFRALECDLGAVKAVILGQDPYPGPGQAHGLAFSVNAEAAIPPSLRNILREVQRDTGAPIPANGDLQRWADQGVLLLNATLTVSAGRAGSHRGRGWERFTDALVQVLNREREHLVFLLWGRDARQKRMLIDAERHLILEAAHPSPLSAHAGFFGCRHFSLANDYLVAHGQRAIVW